MNNNKRKLKKISLHVFDDDDNDVNNNNDNSHDRKQVNVAEMDNGINSSYNNTVIKSNAGVTNETLSSSTISSTSFESELQQEQRDIITKTATWVINNNKDNVTILMNRSKDNPILSFLFESHHTIAGKYYLKELNRLQVEKHVQSVCSGMPIINPIPSAPILSSSSQSSSSSSLATTSGSTSISSSINTHASIMKQPTKSNEKRNRWGPIISDSNATQTTTSASSSSGGYNRSSSSYHDSSGNNNIINNNDNNNRKGDDDFNGHYSDDDNDDNQNEHDIRMEKLLREQKELQLLESRIRDAAKQNLYGSSSSSSSGNITEVAKYISKKSKNNDNNNNNNNNNDNIEIHIAEQQAELYLERLAQYESLAKLDDDNYRDTVDEAERNGGIIEGGTWEHRKRAKEMLKTAAKNLELTLMVKKIENIYFLMFLIYDDNKNA